MNRWGRGGKVHIDSIRARKKQGEEKRELKLSGGGNLSNHSQEEKECRSKQRRRSENDLTKKSLGKGGFDRSLQEAGKRGTGLRMEGSGYYSREGRRGRSCTGKHCETPDGSKGNFDGKSWDKRGKR